MSPTQILICLTLMLGLIAGWWLRGNIREHGDKRKGIPARGQVRAEMGRKVVRESARYTRRSLDDPAKAPLTECGVFVGKRVDPRRPLVKFREPDVWSPIEDSGIIVAPPGSMKTIKLKEIIKDWAGPVVTTSTKLDIIKHTNARRRRSHGKTHLFNPDRLGDQSNFASTIRWNPVADCLDEQAATDRAGYLLSGVSAGGGESDRDFWNDKANSVLRAYLFAAAHGGYGILDVKRWANNPKDRTAVELLVAMGNAPTGWADELGQVLNSYERFRDSVFNTLAQVFNFLGSAGAREIVDIPADDPRQFNARAFLRSKGTLYLIGAHKEYGSIAPLFCALTGLLYDTAKRHGQEKGDRLDPPVLFALDEAPNIVPLPLHRLTAEARGLGITFYLCIQNDRQLEDVWGPTRGGVIWSNCKLEMILPGLSDSDFLERLSQLCGHYQEEKVSTSTNDDGKTSRTVTTETKRIHPPEMIRMLPTGQALVVAANRRAVVVSIDPFWERKSVVRAERKAAKATSTPVPSPPVPRPPTRGGTPVQLPATAKIIPMRRRVEAEVEESSG